MSETTAMMEVAATMLPSTVMKDRSLADQIASSAMAADSRNWFISPRLLVLHSHGVAVGHPTDGVVGAGDHEIASVEAAQDFEIPVAGNPHLDLQELCPAVAQDEDPFCLLPRLAGLELLRGHRGLHAGRSATRLVVLRLLHDLAVGVVDQLANGDGRDRD